MAVHAPEHPHEPIVLDGSNIAHRAGLRDGGFGVLLALEGALLAAGWEVLVVVDASLRHRIDTADQELLEERIDAGWVQVPKGTDADTHVLDEAARLDAWVVSHDQFRDHPEPPARRIDPALLGAVPFSEAPVCAAS